MKNSNLDYDALVEYLQSGGCLRKDCWLNVMHIRYNPCTKEIELRDSSSTSDGTRILGVRERYKQLKDIPYAGKWVKCDERGKPVNECDQVVGEG